MHFVASCILHATSFMFYVLSFRFYCSCTVAAPAIDKLGPRPYHFRLGPPLGPTTRPRNQKSNTNLHWNFRSLTTWHLLSVADPGKLIKLDSLDLTWFASSSMCEVRKFIVHLVHNACCLFSFTICWVLTRYDNHTQSILAFNYTWSVMKKMRQNRFRLLANSKLTTLPKTLAGLEGGFLSSSPTASMPAASCSFFSPLPGIYVSGSATVFLSHVIFGNLHLGAYY